MITKVVLLPQSGDATWYVRRSYGIVTLRTLIAERDLQRALSQSQNLYIVAYSGDIYVYVPQYPTQELPQTPALIVQSQPTGPGRYPTFHVVQLSSLQRVAVGAAREAFRVHCESWKFAARAGGCKLFRERNAIGVR